MSRILDTSKAQEIADAVVPVVADEGYSAEEMIPGFVQAIIDVARMTSAEEAYLDAAANLLADGGEAGYGI